MRKVILTMRKATLSPLRRKASDPKVACHLRDRRSAQIIVPDQKFLKFLTSETRLGNQHPQHQKATDGIIKCIMEAQAGAELIKFPLKTERTGQTPKGVISQTRPRPAGHYDSIKPWAKAVHRERTKEAFLRA